MFGDKVYNPSSLRRKHFLGLRMLVQQVPPGSLGTEHGSEGSQQRGQPWAFNATGLSTMRKTSERKVASCQNLLHIFGSTSFLASRGYLAHLKCEESHGAPAEIPSKLVICRTIPFDLHACCVHPATSSCHCAATLCVLRLC